MIMTSDYSYINDRALKLYDKTPRRLKIEYGDVISLDFDIYISDIDVYFISINSNIINFHTNNFKNIKNRKEIRKEFLECIDKTKKQTMETTDRTGY